MTKTLRGEVLDGAPLHHAPENELGVVFLFAHLARRWRLRIDTIRSGFPDCIAYQKIQGKERRIRIEFEFKSRNFKLHKHKASSCDWLVCWENNWPDSPQKLKIIELRREYGLGFNVWIMPVNEPYKSTINKSKYAANWSLPSQSHKGDLVLFYLTRPEKLIQDVFLAVERSRKIDASWKKGKDYMGPIRRICHLDAPIFLDDMRTHRVLRTAHFIRNQMQGRPNATEYWPFLYDMIVRRNPSMKQKLKAYAPERV